MATVTPEVVDNRSPIVIDEPIVLAALVQWWNSRPEHNFMQRLEFTLRAQYGGPNDSQKGLVFEDILLFKLSAVGRLVTAHFNLDGY